MSVAKLQAFFRAHPVAGPIPCLVLALLALSAQPALARFASADCPDWKPQEFRYVKVVTRDNDSTLAEPLKLALDTRTDGKTDIYFVERHGKVKRWNAADNTVTQLAFLDTWTDSPDKIDSTGDTEAGLEAIALDPRFHENHWLYLRYEPWLKEVYRIARFEVKGDSLDMKSEKVILEIPFVREHTHKQAIVLGGSGMVFDGEGNLLIAVGANSELSPSVNERYRDFSAEYTASNLASLRGAILRIHPDDSPRGYSIPKGNFAEYFSAKFRSAGNAPVADAYADTAKVKPEIYVKGVRNPYSLAVDPTRNLVAWGEFGPNRMGLTRIEEDNLVSHPSYGGYPYWSGKNEYLLGDMEPWAAAKLDPKAPMNASVWNQGPKELPPSDTPLYAYSAYLNNGFIVGNHPTVGPIYHYDSQSPSPVKLPPHFDKAWFVTDRVGGVRIFELDATGAYLTDSAMLVTEQKMERPLDLQQGGDGALYVVDYGPGWHLPSLQTNIGRIEYTGVCRPGVQSALHRSQAGPRLRIRFLSSTVEIEEPGPHTVRLLDLEGRELRTWRGIGPQAYALGKAEQGGVRLITVTLPGVGRSVSAITAAP